MSKSIGSNKTTLEGDLKRCGLSVRIHWSHVDEKSIRVTVMWFQNYPDLFGRDLRFIFRAKEASAYQSRIGFSVIRLAECQANGRCFETQQRSSCDDRRSVVDLFFFNFTTIIKRVTNFPYIFAGSISEDYRKERLPSTSVGSLHHTEWRYVREL